eukprot:Skav220994  [mRNA]  locus=scaffold1541:290798:296429:+ [translate_table: standard]
MAAVAALGIQEKEQRKELAAKVSSKDVEVQHLLQQLHLANSQVESLHLSAAELRQEMDFQRQQQLEGRNLEPELCTALSRVQELERQLSRQQLEEGRGLARKKGPLGWWMLDDVGGFIMIV